MDEGDDDVSADAEAENESGAEARGAGAGPHEAPKTSEPDHATAPAAAPESGRSPFSFFSWIRRDAAPAPTHEPQEAGADAPGRKPDEE